MKVKIENFGPVKEFEFNPDTPLQLIVGTNNIGKSYALTAYYIAITSLLECRLGMAEIFSELGFFEHIIKFDKSFEKKYLAELENDLDAEIDATTYFEKTAKKVLEYSLLEVFNDKIISSYSDYSSVINQAHPDKPCKITFDIQAATLILVNHGDGFSIERFKYRHKVLSVKESYKDPKPVKALTIPRKSADITRAIHQLRHNSVAYALGTVIIPTSVIQGIYYLPASRSGLYQALSSFGAIIAELSKKRSLFRSKIELPGISAQLSDYYIKLTEINTKAKSTNPFFEELTDRIEKEILQGSINYDSASKKLFYTPNGTKLKLDLSATSSMVSELGPVVAYFRHILSNPKSPDKKLEKYLKTPGLKNSSPTQILIIEEPEAHLHPENQIKVTEIYAQLAQQGVSVILTSHSNYIFNKLSNLIIANKINPKKVKCDLFSWTDGETDTTSIEVNEFGIEDHNFADASEDLLQEKIELLAEMDFSDDQPDSQ
ncbi:AAA family ATPase [Pseudomonas chlororaphis subsp. piscium]